MLKNYTLLSIIGEGAHGKVYLARHTNNTLYAIKKCKLKRAMSQEDVILEVCHHPGIQTMAEKYIVDPYYYLVLDYYGGGDLHEYLCKCSYLCVPEVRVMHYMIDVIAGVSYLHSIGIVHRDLKLENIMLHEGRPKICDFNLSNYDKNALMCKIYCGVDVIMPDVMMNDFLGTLEYLAPEVVNGQYYGYMIDWWAIGIMIYELLYSRTPFHDDDERTILINIKNKKDVMDFPETPIGELSNFMKRFLSKILCNNIKDRLGYLGGGLEILDQYEYFQQHTKEENF